MTFEKLRVGTPQPSELTEWPTKEKPTNEYKFGSLWLELGQDYFIVQRQTYSLLEWLGDVGGLFDGLKLIASPLTGLLAAHNLKSSLLSIAFRNEDQEEHETGEPKKTINLGRVDQVGKSKTTGSL